MPSLTAENLLWLAVPLFVFAPFPLYLKLRRELKQVHDADWRRSFTTLLDMKYGKMSSFSIEEQIASAEKEFERFEAEILKGNFRHKEEFLAYKDILSDVLIRMSGSNSGPYGHYQKRAVIIVEAINKHEEENKDKDSGL